MRRIGGTAVRTRTQLAEEIEIGLAGSLNPRRTAMRLLSLLRPEFADWASLVLPDSTTDGLRLHGGDAVGFTAIVARSPRTDTRLERLLRTGNTDLIPLGEKTAAALAEMVPLGRLRDEVAVMGDGQLLAVGLNARGATLGALMLARRSGFDSDDVAFAARIGLRAAMALDSARLYEERTQIAAVLSGALRPPSLPEVENLRLAARYRPAAEHLDIGGDFYDIIGSGSDWLLALGDVSGKGVKAAAVTGRTRQSVRTAAHFDRHPAAVLRALNGALYGLAADQFVTVLCAHVRVAADGGHADVELATAGHQGPIVIRADGRVEQLEMYGTACGMLSDVEYHAVRLRLHRNDTMLMFTDGVEEARGPDGLLGVERLVALLPAYAGAAADVVCEAVEQYVIEHVDGGPHDDIALLAVSCGR
ncbi:serine phosphatase RsbU, regulator of sigma subunit [Mycolicibacterium chubuense NBB4]|uniref:Serine phosphatase RsbU, regulator of sigma subunit n=1 Tax=Mycolicibacterium chubuense (strain NBB4) TaxID=710421 RepID=I4BNH6_MYCCN|nr:SpoIIE family protein phosphatase [Mycolicibacterium chubuense]AFM18833.1 serine phosphatase RsbU, regulator of sigma subunit [Mycolicibacterium chubuense NBB4]